MNKKSLCRVFTLSTLIMLSLSLITSLLPEPYHTMTSAVQAVSEPSDGDAWTENDNATYPWTVSPKYPDDIAFVGSPVKAGSYSLRVNHTSATVRMRCFCDIGNGSNIDVSSYWAIRFWIRFERATRKSFQVALANHTPFEGGGGKYFRVRIKPQLNEWSEVIVPLCLFVVAGSGASPVWTEIRYIGFYVEENLGSGDGTKIYVDNMRFIEEPTITQTNSLDSTALANLYSAHLGAEQLQVYNGSSYTGLYDWVRINGDKDKEGSLQAEALSQSIFALCWLYDLTSHQFYLDKAIEYAEWLLQFQNSSYGFLHYYYNNNTEYFYPLATTAVTGWGLAGISWLYGLTSNNTWLTMANKMRAWICDYQYVDETGWYTAWDYDDGAPQGAVTNRGMTGGGAHVGLGYYYDKVSQNSTVKSQIDATYSKRLSGLTTGTNILHWGTWEESTYCLNGIYVDGNGTMNNSTFWEHTVQYYGEAIKQQILLLGNGSAYNQMYNCNTSNWDFTVNWGVAVGMPILYKVYEGTGDSNLLECLKMLWFDWLADAKGSAWYIPFASDATACKSWTPTALFVYASLMEYYRDTVNDAYVVSTDGTLNSSISDGESLTLEIFGSAGSTVTTRVYCGDKGEPTAVYAVGGNVTWNCNASTAILTLNVTHASPERILIYWKLPGDLDSNGIVDIFDIGSISAHWYPGPPIGPLGYDVDCDIDNDGAIDLFDICICCGHWAETC